MDLLQAIGRTPLVELLNITGRPDVRILCKLQGCNPGGSVKDRPALFMIAKAEERGALAAGKTILEPTSGNTGIALAMIGAAKGYAVELCMPECVSLERSLILQGLGATVFLTPAREGIDGAIRKALELVDEQPDKYYMPNQYENADNVLAHWQRRSRDLRADRRRGGLLRRRHGHDRHAHGHRSLPEGEDRQREDHRGRAGTGPRHPGPQEHDRIDGARHLRPVRSRRQAHGDRRRGLRDDQAARPARGAVRRVVERRGRRRRPRVAAALDHGTIVALLPDRGDRYLSTTQFRSIPAGARPRAAERPARRRPGGRTRPSPRDTVSRAAAEATALRSEILSVSRYPPSRPGRWLRARYGLRGRRRARPS